MVRRYSHKAIVTIQSGQLVKGEWVAGEPTEIEVTGQYFPSNSGQQLKRNVDGKEFIVHGEFSTKARPVENAKHIRIDSIALDVDIICWGAVSDSLCNLCIAMARKGGLTPMWSDREVERWFDYFVDRAEERIYKLLQRAGEEFVKIARKKGNYQDHTGNLRSSIGYVIVKDGDILTENYKQSTSGNR